MLERKIEALERNIGAPRRVLLGMGAILILSFILLIGPLSVLYGVDSRVYEERPRAWWPGARS